VTEIVKYVGPGSDEEMGLGMEQERREKLDPWTELGAGRIPEGARGDRQ
jgi:hypothetical protein